MGKIYTSMGLMSGTSLDGIDVSIIKSDGNKEYSTELDRYFEYDKELVQKLLEIRDKISNSEDLLGMKFKSAESAMSEAAKSVVRLGLV